MATGAIRRGPRPGGTDTRTEILEAAAAVFSRDGYQRGSVRGIARAAGVDPALVRHYFASKSELFVEALRPPFDLSEQVTRMTEGDPQLVGHRVMAFFVEVWDDPVRGPRIIQLMRAALDHPDVAEFVRTLVIEGVIQRVAAAVGAPNPARAAATAASQVIGLAMLRHAAHIEPLASEPGDELIARFGPILTRLLTDASGDSTTKQTTSSRFRLGVAVDSPLQTG
ncbi:TetR/AcrR family transcriptional regulator [Demequina lutea]|uniref:AcrR family transcriptional regulator n=1 Tax=Demequina lutea TaxID=431489 RepID=A0A7Y9ZBY3_9MICO|nr:TetR family transcriptional regulator [Demequina lutea]NYI42559.1 AcrR family transcriptional regulator [Demequina lutea]